MPNVPLRPHMSSLHNWTLALPDTKKQTYVMHICYIYVYIRSLLIDIETSSDSNPYYFPIFLQKTDGKSGHQTPSPHSTFQSLK